MPNKNGNVYSLKYTNSKCVLHTLWVMTPASFLVYNYDSIWLKRNNKCNNGTKGNNGTSVFVGIMWSPLWANNSLGSHCCNMFQQWPKFPWLCAPTMPSIPVAPCSNNDCPTVAIMCYNNNPKLCRLPSS
jgi:hypothetical protein